jgi:hypothetical protein
MSAKYIWEFGSLIFILLGTIHLAYTFFTNKFSSKNKKVIAEMKSSHPNLTKETTIWKAWIGFNASHSIGVMYIGIINFYLAFEYFSALQSDHFFFLFNILTISFYVWLAKMYWFKIPLIGTLIALIFYILSYYLILMN